MTGCPCTCHAGDPGRYDCSRMVALGGCTCRVRPADPAPDTTDAEPTGPTYRCRRDDRCDGRQQVRDPDTGERLGWEPALPTRGRDDGLCTTCEGRLTAALRALPALVGDLDAHLGRDATATPPSDAPTSRSRERPIPLRGGVEAIRAWIEHLAQTWAARAGAAVDDEHLVDDLGDEWWDAVGPRRELPWADLAPVRRASLGEQLGFLLRFELVLLELPPEPTPVWSTGEHPADWQDLDTVTVGPGRGGAGQLFWSDQDGTTAAMALIEAQRRAERAIGATVPRETSSAGCTRCGWPRMVRDAGDDEWRCPRCSYRRPEAAHDVLRDALLTSRPESGPTSRARVRKERADSAARAARLAAGRHQHHR